jgi:hypothetical protein
MLDTIQPDPFDPPAIVRDVSAETYHAIDAASSHALTTLLDRSPAHVRGMEDKPSDALTLGTITHSAVLEPSTMAYRYRTQPKIEGSQQSNAYKQALAEWLASELGRQGLPEVDKKTERDRLDAQIALLRADLNRAGICEAKQEHLDIAQRCRDAVYAHPTLRPLLADFDPEVTMIARDPQTNLKLKSRVDALPSGHDVLLDLKTAQDASHDGFLRAARNFRYAMQPALYTYVWQLITDRPAAFLFIAVETAPPFGVQLFELEPEVFKKARQKMRVGLDRWATCVERGVWPNYSHGIATLDIPSWAI